ncbi:MAG: hypothetical protein U0905_10970 [Pirellulales bacterium]
MSTLLSRIAFPAYDFRIPIGRCLQAFVFVGAVVLSPSLGLVRADGTQPDTRRKAILRLDQLVQDQKVTASEAEGFRRLFSDFPVIDFAFSFHRRQAWVVRSPGSCEDCKVHAG